MPRMFNFPQYITSAICENGNVPFKGETMTEKGGLEE
jgi:hypothetical protein